MHLPVTSCSACSFGVASQGPCRFAIEVREVGSVVRAAGERARGVIFVRDGYVTLTAPGDGSGEESVALRGPGSLLGLEALDGEPSPHEIRAVSRAHLCTIHGDQMAEWIGPVHGPARAVIDLLLSEARLQREDARHRQGDCLSRVARFVLAQAPFLAERSNGLRKATVARLLDMRAETLSRCLAKLEEAGLVDASRGMRILDREGLSALAAEGIRG